MHASATKQQVFVSRVKNADFFRRNFKQTER